MKVRFFGSSQCKDCLKLFVLLNKFQIDYEYIDAIDDAEVQYFCDEQEIDELPHLQFLDEEDNIVVEHVGYIGEKEFVKYLTNYFSNY